MVCSSVSSILTFSIKTWQQINIQTSRSIMVWYSVLFFSFWALKALHWLIHTLFSVSVHLTQCSHIHTLISASRGTYGSVSWPRMLWRAGGQSQGLSHWPWTADDLLYLLSHMQNNKAVICSSKWLLLEQCCFLFPALSGHNIIIFSHSKTIYFSFKTLYIFA